jgi:hypothetical protein
MSVATMGGSFRVPIMPCPGPLATRRGTAPRAVAFTVRPAERHFMLRDRGLIATRSRRAIALPTVHPNDAIPRAAEPEKEPAMTYRLSSQVAALSLSIAITVAVLAGLNTLAHSEHAATALAKAVASQPT